MNRQEYFLKHAEYSYPLLFFLFLVCDYSKFDEKAKANVKKGLKGVQVGILINNVRISRFKVN